MKKRTNKSVLLTRLEGLMKKHKIKIISLMMALILILSGCVSQNNNKPSSEIIQEEIIEVDNPILFEKSSEEEDYVKKYNSLEEEELLQYIEDSIYADLDSSLDESVYEVENIEAVYISKEYIEEYAFNTRPNIYFGYTLEEVENIFKGRKYVFTLGENGETIVKEFEGYDDTYEKVIRNVAIGSGVILICITVAVATDGLGAPASVCAIFAASAKGATTMALSSGIISGVFSGILTGIQTGDMEQACKAGALSGSEGFMWGAISGALIEGGKTAFLSKGASVVKEATTITEGVKTAEVVETVGNTKLPWQLAEERSLNIYGGKAQCAYLNGVVVDTNTPGSTRPDIVRDVGGVLEAIEVKYYDLESPNNFSQLIRILRDEVNNRNIHMPNGTIQRIVLDVTDRGYSKEFVEEKISIISKNLYDIYPDIPIDIVGL